jgi:hypothetical protein
LEIRGFLSVDFTLVISIALLPIFLAVSLISKSPLYGWFASFWGLGIYQITMTILSDSFLIVEAKMGPSMPVMTSEIAVAMSAPTIAAAIAMGGAWGIYVALQGITDTVRSRGQGPTSNISEPPKPTS